MYVYVERIADRTGLEIELARDVTVDDGGDQGY